jgi:hypothetical protein
MRFLLQLLLLALGIGQYLEAQWPSTVRSGARVQLRLPEVQYQFSGRRGHQLRGKVTALAADTLYVAHH